MKAGGAKRRKGDDLEGECELEPGESKIRNLFLCESKVGTSLLLFSTFLPRRSQLLDCSTARLRVCERESIPPPAPVLGEIQRSLKALPVLLQFFTTTTIIITRPLLLSLL